MNTNPQSAIHSLHFIEILEARIAPANITASVAGHVLTILGNDGDNNVTLDLFGTDASGLPEFAISSTSDLINGSVLQFVTPTGVTDVSIKMLGGDDTVTFNDSSVPIHLKGGLKIDGGDGANKVTTTDLTVDKNMSITNGTAGVGKNHDNELADLTVGGALAINNGQGDTHTDIFRNSAGISTIVGNLSITNGTGRDGTFINDTSFGHNVTIKNGHGDVAGFAGLTRFYNDLNTVNSVIGGNLSVSYVDGDVDPLNPSDQIQDTAILGNVTIDHGTGNFTTDFDGDQTTLPVVIRGSLTMKGTGNNTIEAGTQFNETGLIVGKNLTVTNGNGLATLLWNKLEVGGATKLTLGGANDITISDSGFTGAFAATFGDGGSNAQIYDSIFAGTFTSTVGDGGASFSIDSATGTTLPTIFEKAVLFKLGDGGVTLNLDGTHDASQQVIIDSTFVIKTGGGGFTPVFGGREVFPLGTSIQIIP